MCVVKSFKEIDKFTTLVNPGIPIPEDVSKIHGITDDMIMKSPKFKDVAEKILNVINDGVLVGHNIGFDYGFIKSELERTGYEMPDVYKIDTLRLSRLLCRNLYNHKLETVARSMNLFSNKWHRAENDVYMTKQIFENILRNLIKEKGIYKLNDLLKILS